LRWRFGKQSSFRAQAFIQLSLVNLQPRFQVDIFRRFDCVRSISDASLSGLGQYERICPVQFRCIHWVHLLRGGRVPDECRWRQLVACPVPGIWMVTIPLYVNLIRRLLSRLCCILAVFHLAGGRRMQIILISFSDAILAAWIWISTFLDHAGSKPYLQWLCHHVRETVVRSG
jgi:hypothetical protein